MEFSYSACRRRGGVLNSPHFCFFLLFLFCLIWSEQQIRFLNSTKLFRTCHFSVLSPFQCFIPISAFYSHFSVLSPFQRFILISAFYPHFSVLSPFQRFIPLSVSVFSFRSRHSVSAFYPDPFVLLILNENNCWISSKLPIIAHRFLTKYGADKLGRILAENLPFQTSTAEEVVGYIISQCTSVSVIDKSSRYQIVKFVRAESRKYV